MPWTVRTHRCALPTVPAYYGIGSQWQCGDNGEGCGKIYTVSFAPEGLALVLDSADTETPTPSTVDTPPATVDSPSVSEAGIQLA